MSEQITHSIELIKGYESKDRKTNETVVHKKVTFGNRLTANDFILLDNDPQARNAIQHADLIRRKMIAEFGTLPVPPPLTALLKLDSIDRDDLAQAADEFMVKSRDGREAKLLDNDSVQIMFGFDIDGTNYNIVHFGNRIDGQDQAKASEYGGGFASELFLIGKMISKIETEDGAVSLDGQIRLEKMGELDSEDLKFLRVGAELFRQSFRLKRESVQGTSIENGDGSGDKDGMDGTTDSVNAD